MTISEWTDCANCGACYAVCPCGAVSVRDDGLFYQPVVDASVCVGCGKCASVCPVHQALPETSAYAAFSAIHQKAEVVAHSSSGGAFTALAEAVLEKGGVVFAAAFSEDCRTVHIQSTDQVPLEALRRSKYVESLTGTAFRDAERCLRENRDTLFCGTPCQVAGLHAYLGKAYPNLLTCDFVCGGLPSHTMYREYLDALEKRYRAKVTSVNFRPKSFGWHEYALRVTFANGRQMDVQACFDPFVAAFYRKRFNIREYCVTCQFAGHRSSDITLGDFWRYTELTGHAPNDTGVSLVTANTEKGAAAVRQLTGRMQLEELPVEKVAFVYTPHGVSADYPVKRAAFMDDYAANGVCAAGKKHCCIKGKDAVKAKLRGMARTRKK